MALVALICPHCGGSVQLDEEMKSGFCIHCGTKIVNEQRINGSITIDRTPDIINHLKVAREYLTARNWNAAAKIIENIFLMDAECSDAWYMKALLHIRQSTSKDFIDRAESNGMKNYNIFSKEDIQKCWGECTISLTVIKKSLFNLHEALITIDDKETVSVNVFDESVTFGVNPGKHEIRVRLRGSDVTANYDKKTKLSFIANGDHRFEIKIGIFTGLLFKISIVQLK